MSQLHYITKKEKFKSLSFNHYEYIIREITKFDVLHKGKKRNTGRTQFIYDLASSLNISVSNIYKVINASKITTLDTHLHSSIELSANAAFEKRTKRAKSSNHSKLDKAKPFIKLVINEMKKSKLSSIDETIQHLKLHTPEKIQDMELICTKTMYNYVHQRKIDLKPIDLPRMVSRKNKPKDKTYIPKRQKGTSITERPFAMDDRSEFGHWEGDLVTGPRDGKNGAYLTLIERKTRFYLMIPITHKSSKQVYMKINQLHKFYEHNFSQVFKSITFDNGSEFSRYLDMEIKPGTTKKRTSIYFGRPYRSCDRGSNENCNGLIRYFIKKGTDIGKIDKAITLSINMQINDKKRKILGYLPSRTLFLNELTALNITTKRIFYEIH